jgi:hypothetical protein
LVQRLTRRSATTLTSPVKNSEVLKVEYEKLYSKAVYIMTKSKKVRKELNGGYEETASLSR